MKSVIITALICLLLIDASGQSLATPSVVGKSFVNIVDLTVTRYDGALKQKISRSSFILARGTKFFVNDIVEDGYLVSMWEFTDPEGTKATFYNKLGTDDREVFYSDQTSKSDRYRITKSQVALSPQVNTSISDGNDKFEQLAYIDSWANHMQFFIPLKEFTSKCEAIYPKSNSFTWGFLTLPIKARLGNSKASFSFEEKVNFGLTFGWKRQFVSKAYIAGNLLFGVSIANVKINNDNSQSALSFSTGYMYQYDKFQIGLFTGFDFTDQSQTKWAYQGKPWIGIAIGLSLFGESKTASGSVQNQ